MYVYNYLYINLNTLSQPWISLIVADNANIMKVKCKLGLMGSNLMRIHNSGILGQQRQPSNFIIALKGKITQRLYNLFIYVLHIRIINNSM